MTLYCAICILIAIYPYGTITLKVGCCSMSDKVSKAQQRAVQKYVKNNYDRVVLTLPKGKREEIRQYAKMDDKSMNAYIIQAIENKILDDKAVAK